MLASFLELCICHKLLIQWTHCQTLIKAQQFLNNFNLLFKVNNKNTRKRCDVCSKLTIRALEDLTDWRGSGVFIAMFYTYLTPFKTNWTPFSNVSIVNFERVNVCGEGSTLIQCFSVKASKWSRTSWHVLENLLFILSHWLTI